MKRVITATAAAVAVVVVPTAAFAAPAPAAPAKVVATKVALVNDCGMADSNGDCTDLDMVGTLAGIVKYRQKSKGDVRLVIVVKSAPANVSYDLNVYCGKKAEKRGAHIAGLPEAVTTNAAGTASSSSFEIPIADVKSACGTGKVVGHIELVNAKRGSILDAAPIEVKVA